MSNHCRALARLSVAEPGSDAPGSDGGFTLIELIMVLAVLSGLMLIILPRIPFVDEYAFKSEARRMAGLIRYIDENSTAKKVYFRLWFHPGKPDIEIESSVDGREFKKSADTVFQGVSLNSGVLVGDVVMQGMGKVSDGELGVIFNPGAGAEPFVLHLTSNERAMTIEYNPFSGKVKIKEGYV